MVDPQKDLAFLKKIHDHIKNYNREMALDLVEEWIKKLEKELNDNGLKQDA